MNKTLTFLGVGSAFNSRVLGNTSAYFTCGETMTLFDCGESVFSRIQTSNILDAVKHLKVFVTHNHPDHIGSLGSLIFYCFFVKKIDVEVYGNQDLRQILNLSGVYDNQYKFIDIFSFKTLPVFQVKPVLGAAEFNLTPILTKHVDNLISVGYYVKEKATGESFYYSGDSCEIPEVILNNFLKGNITYLYQDTSWLDYKDNVHLSLKKLMNLIDKRRNYVYIMHTDTNFNTELAEHAGFKLAGKGE